MHTEQTQNSKIKKNMKRRNKEITHCNKKRAINSNREHQSKTSLYTSVEEESLLSFDCRRFPVKYLSIRLTLFK